MSNIVEFNHNDIIGEEIGTVCVSMYKDVNTGLPFFYVKSENEDVLPVSYVIEDTLYNY